MKKTKIKDLLYEYEVPQCRHKGIIKFLSSKEFTDIEIKSFISVYSLQDKQSFNHG